MDSEASFEPLLSFRMLSARASRARPTKCAARRPERLYTLRPEILGYSESMITSVTRKNQVTVPAGIVVAEIEPGRRLQRSATEREHVMEVRVLPSAAAVAAGLRGRGLRYKYRSGSAVDARVHEREREDDRR